MHSCCTSLGDQLAGAGGGPHDFHMRAAAADRKSTRLNSSHLVISYAVFCLKKKNTQHKHRPHLLQALDAVMHLVMEHWACGLRKSRHVASLPSMFPRVASRCVILLYGPSRR